MEIQFYGANCVRVTTKKASIVVDDNLGELGQKAVTKSGDIAIFTDNNSAKHAPEAKFTIDAPGEYEVSSTSFKGVAARGHMEEEGKQGATIFRIVSDDIRIVFVGHIYPELTDEQLEAIGTVDVLVIPVGGSGYTLDPIGALKVIKKIEPKVIIPTHYADKAIKYEVPQQTLEEALKVLAIEAKPAEAKLKLKATELTEQVQVAILERQ
jgi:L-ascorbate metabolism protein UlaG (beta-lactamase superfamily)